MRSTNLLLLLLLHSIFVTPVAWYSLIVLKVPLNTDQSTNVQLVVVTSSDWLVVCTVVGIWWWHCQVWATSTCHQFIILPSACRMPVSWRAVVCGTGLCLFCSTCTTPAGNDILCIDFLQVTFVQVTFVFWAY